MRRPLLLALPAALLLAAACSTATQGAGSEGPTDRVLVTDAQGQTMRQSSLNDRATMTFAAPLARVWPAVIASYADVGIDANYADQARGRYGVHNLAFPKSLGGERVGTFFSCGSTLTGALVDQGTVRADVVTTVAATPEGSTNATIAVTGWLRRNDGNSSDAISCLSTGRLEELLRKSVEKKLAPM